MNPITQGLYISALGLLLTFTALGIFILVMIVLQRIFPYKPEGVEEAENAEGEIKLDDEKREIAAAIAAAIYYERSLSQQTQHEHIPGSLGSVLETGHGVWWTAGVPKRKG